MKKYINNVALLLLIGILIREILAPFTGHPFDLEIWVRLGYYVSQGNDPYRITGPINDLSIPGTGYLPSIGYSPLWAFIQVLFYFIYSFLSIENRFFYYALIKQIMIFSDIVIAYILYKNFKEIDKIKALKMMKFWLFCPLTIIFSSVWGMFDQLTLLFLILALENLRKTFKSSSFEGIAISLKSIPIIFLPLLAFVAGRKIKQALFYIFISITTLLIISLVPYLIFPNWNYSNLQNTGIDVISKVGNSMNYFVILHLLGNHFNLQNVYIIVKIIGYFWPIAILLSSIFLLKKYNRKDLGEEKLYSFILFLILLFYLTRTQINEQYIIYFLYFGLIQSVFYSDSNKLFNRIWIFVFLFLFSNNVFLIRFLEPISIYYYDLELYVINSFYGFIREILMGISGLSFSYFCFKYLIFIYNKEIKQ